MADVGKIVAIAKAVNKVDSAIVEQTVRSETDTWLASHITNPDSPPLDRSLSSSSSATPADITGNLKSALGDGLRYLSGSFSSGAWVSSNYSAFIKVIPGSHYKFVRDAASSSSSFAGLKSVSFPLAVGDAASYSDEDGWTEPRTISNHSTDEGIIPSDVNWLWFYAGATTNYTRIPTTMEINGISVFDTVVDDINKLSLLTNDSTYELDKITQYAFYGARVTYDSLINPDNWVVGSMITDVGANRNNTAACRSTYFGLKTITRIRLNHSDYIFNVWGYSASSVESMVAMLKQRYDGEDVLIAPNNGITRYRIAVKKKNGSTFTGDYSDTTSDLYKVLNALETYISVDDSLTAAGVAADAKVTGDQLTNLNANNSKLIMTDITDTSETTVNGVTYSVSNGLATFSGEATANIRINRFGGSDYISSFLEENTDYFVELNETGTKNVRVVINTYKDHAVVKTLFASSAYGSFNTGSFEDIEGIVIRYSIAKGEEVDATVRLKIYNAPGNKYIMMDSQNAPKKIRVMQYNIGKFNMGRDIDDEPSESGYYRLITTDNFNTFLTNYKRVLGDVQPDIIGFEEYEKNVNVFVPDQEAPTKPTVVDHVADMDTLLFNRLYPFGRDDVSTGVKSKKATKSKYKLTSAKRQNIVGSYTYDGVDYTVNSHVIYATIDIDGKNIAVMTNAFPNKPDGYTDEQDLLMKKAIYQAAVDFLEDEEYAIIICDSNARPEKMESIMTDVLIPAGYNSAMGSYFPWQTTIETIHGNQAEIDNIFYKEAKIQLVNFHVLWDEWANLCSDHVPVYADLMLM